jgi:hypothetical protein
MSNYSLKRFIKSTLRLESRTGGALALGQDQPSGGTPKRARLDLIIRIFWIKFKANDLS